MFQIRINKNYRIGEDSPPDMELDFYSLCVFGRRRRKL